MQAEVCVSLLMAFPANPFSAASCRVIHPAVTTVTTSIRSAQQISMLQIDLNVAKHWHKIQPRPV